MYASLSIDLFMYPLPNCTVYKRITYEKALTFYPSTNHATLEISLGSLNSLHLCMYVFLLCFLHCFCKLQWC